MDGHNFARLIITRIDDVNDESKKRKLIFLLYYTMFHKAKNILLFIYFNVICKVGVDCCCCCCLFRPIYHRKHKKGH